MTDGRYDSLPPRPDKAQTVTLKRAAAILGVDRELVEGLVTAKEILGYQATGRTGEKIALVDRADLRRVQALMASK